MEYKLEGGRLSILLPERIDTAVSETVNSEINDICQREEHSSLVLDAEHLSFIASSGLRILVSLARKEKNLRVVNTCLNVYNVFEMTGFTRIMKVEKALRKINLKQCEQIGFGGNGAVYRVSEDEIVKVNYNRYADEEIELEMQKAKEAFIMGIPTAISFDVVDCGEGNRGVIYETIKSKTLGETFQQDNNVIEEYVPKYVELLNVLHNTHTDNPIFDNIKENYHQQALKAGTYFTPEEAEMLLQIWEALPDGNCLVHGDAHPKNVMVQDGELMWIDMATLSVGHPIFDLISIVVLISGLRSDEMAMRLAGMNLTTMKKVYDAFLRSYFHTDDPEMLARLDKMCSLLRFIRSVFAISFNTPETNKMRPLIINAARERLFPNLQAIIGAIKFLS